MGDLLEHDPRGAVARAARESRARLVAFLAARWRDPQAAEDAVAMAFERALARWPEDGVPSAPEAWLLTTARRLLVDASRHARVRTDLAHALATLEEERLSSRDLLDHRLPLLLVCAHPAIDPAVRPALMLQVVLGVEVRRMASVFLLSPEALTQRLVRAKTKIRTSGLRFPEPDGDPTPDRLQAVLEAIYGAYFLGREAPPEAAHEGDDLRSEALHLAEVVSGACAWSAEALGLHALLELCESRRPGAVSDDGAFVPLLAQDPGRWDHARARHGHELLARAAKLGERGPFQLEAAIAAAHSSRAYTGEVPWAEIVFFYGELVAHHPTLGGRVGHAVALAHGASLEAAAQQLAELPASDVEAFQPYWVAVAFVEERLGRTELARAALRRAVGLTVDPRVRRWLQERCARLA